MIFDAFTFFNELDVLEIRLNVLSDYVDKFILIESRYSHQNKQKPLFYDLNKDIRFSKFKEKIHHVVIDKFSDTSYWGPENSQRNMIFNEISSISKSNKDIIFISDLDEIWDPLKIYHLLDECEDDVLYRIRTVVTYHYLNFISKEPSHLDWQHPMFCQVGFLKQMKEKGIEISSGASGLRGQKPCGNYKTHVFEGYNGWHFSYSEDPVEKVKNFCHSECSNMTKEHFDFCIEKKINPFSMTYPMLKVNKSELQGFLPEYVFKNLDKYERLIMN